MQDEVATLLSWTGQCSWANTDFEDFIATSFAASRFKERSFTERLRVPGPTCACRETPKQPGSYPEPPVNSSPLHPCFRSCWALWAGVPAADTTDFFPELPAHNVVPLRHGFSSGSLGGRSDLAPSLHPRPTTELPHPGKPAPEKPGMIFLSRPISHYPTARAYRVRALALRPMASSRLLDGLLAVVGGED